MDVQTNFKFLNSQEIMRKNASELAVGEKSFIKLNLLDNQNNYCSFMIFNKSIKDKIMKMQLKPLQDIIVKFKVVFNNNLWQVQFVDCDIR